MTSKRESNVQNSFKCFKELEFLFVTKENEIRKENQIDQSKQVLIHSLKGTCESAI